MRFATLPPRAIILVLVVATGMAACATPPQSRGLRDNPPDIAAAVELEQVPFFPQQQYHCGPAALAAVLNYRGDNLSPEEIAEQVYVPGLEGSLQVEIVAATRQYGYLPVQLDGSLESLLIELAAGNPVFVLQNLALPIYPLWHYEVVIGYDLEQRLLILRSGVNRRITRSFATFERTWQRAGFWALVIVDADSTPASVPADAYLDAAIGMEQVGKLHVARRAYATASRRWPRNSLALGGLGNSSYALGDYSGAETAYLAALVIEPENAEIWNNLAYARAQLGKHDLSMQAIARARKLDPANPNYVASQAELQNWQ